MPPKGVETRTVASSFHISRPESGTKADCCVPTGSTLKEASCGELGEKVTVLPLTFASDCGTALSAGLHPTRDRQSRERSGTRHRVNAVRRLDQALVPQGCLRIAQRFSACHYPHLFNYSFRISTPSHIHIRRCQPRQIVCQPGIPSCLRARKPPNRAVATSTLRLFQPPLGRPNFFSKIAKGSGPKLSLASNPSGRLRASILVFSSRTATTARTAINGSSRPPRPNWLSSAPAPLLSAL